MEGELARFPAAVARPLSRACLALGFVALTACAPMISARPTSMIQDRPAAESARVIRIEREVPITLSTGYQRSLVAGSLWVNVGRIPEGTVYRPLNSTFAIEGRQVHEAYLVISGGVLQGFYLPGEINFSALTPSVFLPLKEIKE